MFRFAVGNLRSRPARTALALLGLTVAIMGMVGLFSVAEGVDQMVDDAFSQIPGLLVMQRGAPIPLFSRVPKAWGDELRELDGVGVVSEEVWTRVNLIDGKSIVSPPRFLFGGDIEARQNLQNSIYRDKMSKGRSLTLEDIGTTNAVISQAIADEFQKEVGQSMMVNGTKLTIVGIYDCGSLMLDVTILVDIGEVRRVTRFNPGAASCFYIEPTDLRADQQPLIDAIKQKFKGRKLEAWQPSASISAMAGESQTGSLLLDLTIKAVTIFEMTSLDEAREEEARIEKQNQPTSPSTESSEPEYPIEIRNATDWAERFDEFSKDLDIFLSVMTTIGVTIAILSIINTMLMSVSERIIEFGILKANGWSKYDIMKLITAESAVIGIIGGILGCSIGWIGTLVLNRIWPEHLNLYASPSLLIFSLGFSTLLGIVGGLYPAFWAMKMQPMNAIRRG